MIVTIAKILSVKFIKPSLHLGLPEQNYNNESKDKSMMAIRLPFILLPSQPIIQQFTYQEKRHMTTTDNNSDKKSHCE